MERTFAGKYQQNNRVSDATNLIELLAAIVIGVFGMFLAELGNEINSPIIYWSGIVASISAAGYITMKFLTAIMGFINTYLDLKERTQRKTSKTNL